MFLIGGGVLENEIKLKIKRLGLERRVVFAGVRNDVRKCLMAMDVMVFPSFYEGMPNVVIEAQATGLPCVVSDSITAECKLTDRVSFLSLEDTPNEWAKTALKKYNDGNDRELYCNCLKISGYDIKDVEDFLVLVMSDYEKLYKENSELRGQVQTLQQTVDHYSALEVGIDKTVENAQTEADSIKLEAQKQAESIKTSAEADAQQRLEDLQRQIIKAEVDIETKKNQMRIYKIKVQSMLEAQLKILNDEDE